MTFSIDNHTWRSPNYNKRPAGTDIWSIIVHTCEGKPPGDEQQSSLPWLCNPASEVSSHYYITREARIYCLVDDIHRAWHAGESIQNGVPYCNNFSIGIELEHRDNGPAYPQVQLDALAWLCQRLMQQYQIRTSDIETHRRVAQNAGRTDKFDPTDWDDTSFYAWTATLRPAAQWRQFEVVAHGTVVTDRRPDAPLAAGPVHLAPGTIVNVGDVRDGWLWISPDANTDPGIGFYPQSYARPL